MAKQSTIVSFTFCILCTLTFSVLADGESDHVLPSRASIGYFNFALRDSAMKERVYQTEANWTSWYTFMNFTFTSWAQNLEDSEVDFEDNEEFKVRAFANVANISSENIEVLLKDSKDDYAAALQSYKNDSQRLWTDNRTDLLDKVLDRTLSEFGYLEHNWLAAYAGVGLPVKCSEQVNQAISGMNEWEKTGMSAANTLMALLPTFLAFGNL